MINVFMFLATTCYAIILTKIARNWHHVVREISKIEFNLKATRKTKNVHLGCNIFLYVTFTSLVVEKLIALLFFTKVARVCSETYETADDKWYIILKCLIPQHFNYSPYATWKFIIFRIVYIQASILSGVINTIVMCLSVYLISYFRDFNRIIKTRKNKSSQFWEKQRYIYTQLENLVKIMNGQLNCLIMFSFLVYLFFICVQLFFVINSYSYRLQNCNERQLNEIMFSTEYILYFTTSTLLPILRALVSWLLAANVHIEAQKPLLYLHEVPDSNYNVDVVSKIITYELVMLQLNKTSRLHIDLMLENENSTVAN
ncbi:hypothetical protein evm_003310 [Chilo suppressalis]|nr:hypothetical protein evm_003310 [Chilo suppressalis]